MADPCLIPAVLRLRGQNKFRGDLPNILEQNAAAFGGILRCHPNPAVCPDVISAGAITLRVRLHRGFCPPSKNTPALPALSLRQKRVNNLTVILWITSLTIKSSAMIGALWKD
ncbi:MAG: hypothetical protein LBD55_01625 [Treponema sp.]|nr:hypothetical protein [Treponema sp.]